MFRCDKVNPVTATGTSPLPITVRHLIFKLGRNC